MAPAAAVQALRCVSGVGAVALAFSSNRLAARPGQTRQPVRLDGQAGLAKPCDSVGKHMNQQVRGHRVLAIGNTIIDTVLSMPRLPVDDKIWVDFKQKFVGGQGMNAAQDMALLGLDISIVTRIGDDADGDFAYARFQDLGLNVQHCIRVPGALTMSACVTIETEAQTRSCLMHRDALMVEHDPSSRLFEVIREIEAGRYVAVYTDGHQLDLAMPLVEAAVKCGVRVVADVEVLDDQTMQLAKLATELVAPVATILALAGRREPGEAALLLADVPGRVVIATAGAEGSYGAQHGDAEACFVPAHSGCQAVDTVGAGDAYHAGYMAAAGRGLEDYRERMVFATRVAAALCETHGPVVSVEALRRYGLLLPVEV